MSAAKYHYEYYDSARAKCNSLNKKARKTHWVIKRERYGGFRVVREK